MAEITKKDLELEIASLEQLVQLHQTAVDQTLGALKMARNLYMRLDFPAAPVDGKSLVVPQAVKDLMVQINKATDEPRSGGLRPSCNAGAACGDVPPKPDPLQMSTTSADDNTVEVYARPECIFVYCPNPDICKSGGKCVSPSRT